MNTENTIRSPYRIDSITAMSYASSRGGHPVLHPSFTAGNIEVRDNVGSKITTAVKSNASTKQFPELKKFLNTGNASAPSKTEQKEKRKIKNPTFSDI